MEEVNSEPSMRTAFPVLIEEAIGIVNWGFSEGFIAVVLEVSIRVPLELRLVELEPLPPLEAVGSFEAY